MKLLVKENRHRFYRQNPNNYYVYRTKLMLVAFQNIVNFFVIIQLCSGSMIMHDYDYRLVGCRIMYASRLFQIGAR